MQNVHSATLHYTECS